MISGTQFFIPVEDIKNDLVFLKDGSVTLVITTSAVNFGLLFETEQISIIDAFAGLLNSLSFPIQVVVHSKRMDASAYLHTIDQALKLQTNPALKVMTVKYRQFVESIIKENNVLDKQFYICLHITPSELGVFAGHGGEDKNKKALTVLKPRCDHLIRQLSRLGLKARQLNNKELIRLFYEIYNPVRSEPAVKVVKKQPTEKGKQSRNMVSKFQLQQPTSITPQQLVGQAPPQNDNLVTTNNPQPTMNYQQTTNNPFIVEEVQDA